MDLFDLQTTLTVVVILTATAVVVFFDYLRKRRSQQPQRITISQTARPHRAARIFEPAPVDFSVARKLAAERPLEPLVAIAALPPQPAQLRAEPPSEAVVASNAAPSEPSSEPLVPVATSARPHVEPRIELETVTVEMAPPSPSAPSGPAETQSAVSLQTFSLAANLPPITIDAALWERLISSQPKSNLLSAAGGESQPIHQTPARQTSSPQRLANTIEANYQMIHEDGPDSTAEPQPRGMIQQPALERWLEKEQRFSGLVVSIGINDSDSSMWHSQGLMQSVGNYIAGLLRAKDYYCRTSYDEFLIVCPGELGAQSQRRLNHISERLWDYQLRGIGATSILFSWGGVQIEDQPLAEAVASATERMRETKRSGHAAQSGHARRLAV
jgi:hypothetical protein